MDGYLLNFLEQSPNKFQENCLEYSWRFFFGKSMKEFLGKSLENLVRQFALRISGDGHGAIFKLFAKAIVRKISGSDIDEQAHN